MLLSIPDKEFFSMRLTNARKLKRASQLIEKFLNVYPFFRKFLFVENRLSPHDGHCKIRDLMGRSWSLVNIS
jgi:hypothetical protein